MTTPLRQRMIDDPELASYSENPGAQVASVRKLAEHDRRSPGRISSVSIVGTHLRSVLHDMPTLFGELEKQEVYLLAHAANDHSLTFVVDEERTDGLARTLHRDLMQARLASPVVMESGGVADSGVPADSAGAAGGSRAAGADSEASANSAS